MTDASDIYRRFVKTPLRLKTRAPSSCFSPSTSLLSTQHAGTGSRSALASPSGREKTETTSQGLGRKKKRVTRSVNLKNEDTGADFVDTPTRASNLPKRFRNFRQDLSHKDDAMTSRAETCNAFTGSQDGGQSENARETTDSLDTKADSNVSSRQKSVTVTLSLRRSQRLQHVKAACSKLVIATQSLQQEAEPSKKQKYGNGSPLTEKIVPLTAAASPDTVLGIMAPSAAAQTSVDLISTYCDLLLSTNTISGCFIALAWNAVRDVEHSLVLKSTSGESNLFTCCMGIAECEKLAQSSFPPKVPISKSPKSPKPTKVKMSGSRQRSSEKLMAKAKTKKSVRFRSFDLSCLNLQYVENEQVAIMVDKILTRYGIIMEYIEMMASQFDFDTNVPAKRVLRELSRVMASPSVLYSSSHLTTASKRIYRRAFGAQDCYSQHEIRICGEYFARQFANLLVPRVSPSSSPQFLQGVFSSLVSSLVRFKLRVLFIESDDFGEDARNSDGLQNCVLLDEDGNPFPAVASYEHQDLGAAIHWALQESVLYWSLVQPLHDMLVHGETGASIDGGIDATSPVMKYLEKSAVEDLDHVKKYILARRFLRFHLTKSRCQVDADAAETWRSIEKACVLAKRFRFEDESHLFPLASVDEFITLLAHEESTLQLMEAVMQSFYEQRHGTRCMQLEPCMECHHIITREETLTSIRCTTCARRFHLGCLCLPESFAQYAECYTCPTCFLGRGGY